MSVIDQGNFALIAYKWYRSEVTDKKHVEEEEMIMTAIIYHISGCTEDQCMTCSDEKRIVKSGQAVILKFRYETVVAMVDNNYVRCYSTYGGEITTIRHQVEEPITIELITNLVCDEILTSHFPSDVLVDGPFQREAFEFDEAVDGVERPPPINIFPSTGYSRERYVRPIPITFCRDDQI